jgi:hypothetical protein
VIDFFDIFIAVVDIEMCSVIVNIFRFELAAVMIDRAFTDHCTYRSLHFITSNLQNFTVLGSVTLVKSNAKALLTAFCHQKLLLRSPRGLRGVAPLSADNSPAGLSFEKGTLHPA